ncbi:unnamed protein product [Prunus armeniaca]
MNRTRRGTIETSSSRPNRQRPMASTRRERADPQDHFEDTVPGTWSAAFDPFALMQSRYYHERDEHMLSFTRPLVALGETVVLRTRPSQVYQAVDTLQQILEGTNIRYTMTYQRRHG